MNADSKVGLRKVFFMNLASVFDKAVMTLPIHSSLYRTVPSSSLLPSLPSYAEVPGAPVNVTITGNTQRSQVLSWVAPFDGNRPITQNIIYFSSSRQPNLTQIHPPLGGGRTRRQTTGVSSDPVPIVTLTDDPTTVIVSELIPFVEYSYTVVAVNELGRSDMSQPSPSVQTEAAGESILRRGFLSHCVMCISCVAMYVCTVC